MPSFLNIMPFSNGRWQHRSIPDRYASISKTRNSRSAIGSTKRENTLSKGKKMSLNDNRLSADKEEVYFETLKHPLHI